MRIKFQIVKSVVVNAVKATTYLKGKIDESGDANALKLSYNETAGDDETHEAKLTHLFDTALEKAKIIFADYLVPTAQTIGDNVIYYNDKSDNVVEFTLNVSRRYNGTMANTLARLVANYIECYMTYWWWVETTNLKQAEPYVSELSMAELQIRRSFVLCPPSVPTIPYTTQLSAKVDGTALGGELNMEVGEENSLTYIISDGAIDDIEARSKDPEIVSVLRGVEKNSFVLKAMNSGVTEVKLYSRHNDTLEVDTEIIVTDEQM